MKKPTTRRELLRLGVGAALAASATRLLPGCAAAQRKVEDLPVPAPHPDLCATPAARGANAARVVAVKGLDLPAMTREALEGVGGIAAVVKAGDRVFVKPNMVTLPWASAIFDPLRGGECTKVELLVAVAEACLEAGAAEVVIGDASQQPRFDWSRARSLDGKTNLVDEARRLSTRHGRPVRLVCLDAETPEWIEVPTALSFGKVAVSSLVLHTDKVISVPVAKTHRWGYFTLSIKNFIGVTPLARYGWGDHGRVDRYQLHINDRSPRDFNRLAVDIAKAVKPALAVVDMSIGMEGDGPSRGTGGTAIDVRKKLGAWLVLASTDLAAADATAARIMGQDEWKVQEILGMARDEGLGAMCAGDIDLVGGPLEALQMHWKPARPGKFE